MSSCRVCERRVEASAADERERLVINEGETAIAAADSRQAKQNMSMKDDASLSLSRHSRREETRDDTEMSCKCAPHDSRDAVAGVRSERSKHRREKRRRGGSAACHQLLSSRRRGVAGEGRRRSCSSSSRRRHDFRRRITFSSETAREREVFNVWDTQAAASVVLHSL